MTPFVKYIQLNIDDVHVQALFDRVHCTDARHYRLIDIHRCFMRPFRAFVFRRQNVRGLNNFAIGKSVVIESVMLPRNALHT